MCEYCMRDMKKKNNLLNGRYGKNSWRDIVYIQYKTSL